MIVVGTNQIAYLLIEGERTAAVRRVFLRDPDWAAPLLWRSEFRSILAFYLRRGELDIKEANQLHRMAEQLVKGREHLMSADVVLPLIERSGCSAYDCEFVALAIELAAPLITSDKAILRAFPELAVAPDEFAGIC